MDVDRRLDNKSSIFNRVKAKNLTLSANEYNTLTNKINSRGILFTTEEQYKDVQKRRLSIEARLNTNIHIDKKQGGYDAKEHIGVDKINELKGAGKEINTNVLRKEYIERGRQKSRKQSRHKIEHNPRSLTINRPRLERAIKNTKDYEYNKILNSVPINRGVV